MGWFTGKLARRLEKYKQTPEDPEQAKFIDIDPEEPEEEVEEDPQNMFGIEGEDLTGRNMAYSSYKKVESSVVDAYDLLGNEEDQELFYDYLIANLKLYFDKFEGELTPTLEEPTNPEYEAAKKEEPAEGGEEEIEPAAEEEFPPTPPTLEEVASTNEILRKQLDDLIQWRLRAKMYKAENERLEERKEKLEGNKIIV